MDTDLCFKFSKKYMTRIYPWSGLPLETIFVGGGVVDADYRGNIPVILANLSKKTMKIEIGDRIPQVFFMKKEEAVSLLRKRSNICYL